MVCNCTQFWIFLSSDKYGNQYMKFILADTKTEPIQGKIFLKFITNLENWDDFVSKLLKIQILFELWYV